MPALGLLLFMKTIKDNTPGQKVRWNKNYLIFIFLPKKVKKLGRQNLEQVLTLFVLL